MEIVVKSALLAVLFCALAFPGMAAETLDQVSYVKVSPSKVQENVFKDKDLASKNADFQSFAKIKVKQLNRNHRFSREHMEITKQPDGRYRARYHQIDDSTLGVTVRRSQSKSIPFVGVLSYTEQVFESIANSPDQLEQGSFAVVEVIPNRHIFSYQKGGWN